jgi:hypothetical protein
MSYLIDDVARTLASPMPRRKAFAAIGRLLGGATLGAVFSSVGLAAVAAGCGAACKLNGGDTCPTGMTCSQPTGNGVCNCNAGTCCCTTSKACLTSVGGSGNCRTGFTGC